MSEGSDKRVAEKPGSSGLLDNAIDSEQHSGRASWDKRGQKTAAGLSDELDAQDLSPDELRRLRRRISNRESARRLRKQRNEKLHTLVAQQDTLQAENEALSISITAAKTVLQRLNEENEALRAQLGDKVKMPEIAVPKLLNASLTENAVSKARGGSSAAPDTSHVLRLPAAQVPASSIGNAVLLSRPSVDQSGSAAGTAVDGVPRGTQDGTFEEAGTGVGDGSASPPSNATADTSAAVPDKPTQRAVGMCTDMPPPPPPAMPTGVLAAAVVQQRSEHSFGSSTPSKRAKLGHVESSAMPVHGFAMAVSTTARQG